MQRDCFDFFLNFAAVVWTRTEVKPWSFIWPVTTPVGAPARLGTLCSSNWGISFFLFLWESVDWPSPFLSLSLSLSVFVSLPSTRLNLVVSFLLIDKFSCCPFAFPFSQNLWRRFVSCSLQTCSCSLSLFSPSLRPVGGWMAAGQQQWEYQSCA